MARTTQTRPVQGPGGGRRGNAAARGKLMKMDDNAKKSFVRVLKFAFQKHLIWMALVVACIFISAQASVQGTMFLQTLIDDYITPYIGTGAPDTIGLRKAIIRIGIVYLIGILATFTKSVIMMFVTQDTLRRIRQEMFVKMQTLPIGYFDTHTHGEIMSHYTNDTDTLRQMVSQTMPQLINSVVTIVSVVVSMFRLSGRLTLISFITVFVMLKVTTKIGSLSGMYFVKQQADLATINGYIEEHLEGQKVVKVFTHEDKAKEEFDRLNEKLCDSMTKANGFSGIMGPITGNLGRLNYCIIAICGAAMAINGVGGITIGTIASFLLLVQKFNMPVSNVTQQFNTIVLAMAGAGRIFALIDQEPESDEGKVELVSAIENADGTISEADHNTNKWAWKLLNKDGTYSYRLLRGDVVFDDVDFGYTDEKMVLHNISLYAKPGQKIAFVGATGAGKTTITNLINRFYDIQDGKIRFDGINVNNIRKSDLRRSLGMVLQDTHLFTGTIADNIRYGKLDATDEEVIAAAKIANAHSFITHLPDGYNTMLTGDGASLSQGQRQLLSIARAAVANPPALILDEATSSIDTRTEATIQSAMDKLMEGRTVFVIAHRLSTVRNSDAIMVLEQGRIIERGTHDELIALKGKYYQLYTGKLELD